MTKPLSIDELDGIYEVRSETQDGERLVDGDGRTEIRNGLTFRKDKQGHIWESAFSIIGENLVQMESTLDPSHAENAGFIRDDKGNLTKSMVTYKTILRAERPAAGAVVLTGEIEHAERITRLFLTKTS